jgi:hypothetical protein
MPYTMHRNIHILFFVPKFTFRSLFLTIQQKGKEIFNGHHVVLCSTKMLPQMKFHALRWYTLSLMSHRACCHTCYTIQHKQITNRQEHQTRTDEWHTHAATYCVIIQTQRTQISGRNSNGTKHSGGPPWRWSRKNTKTCRGFILKTRF